MDELEMPESFLDSGMLSFEWLLSRMARCVCDQIKNWPASKFWRFSDLPNYMEELSQMSPDRFIKTLEKPSLKRVRETAMLSVI